jgi:uncharacterized protein YvpB
MSKRRMLHIVFALVLCTSCSNGEHVLSTTIAGQLSMPEVELETMEPVLDQTDADGIVADGIDETSQVSTPADEHFIDVPDKEHLIDVPAMSQYPEYFNGCEITSLAMLTNYLKLPFDRQELINMLASDETPLQNAQDGSIEVWGDPDLGFVGDITGNEKGYGVYHKPIGDLLAYITNGHAVDLTGNDFSEVERQITLDHPVVIWTTSNFTPVNNWVDWKTLDGNTIHATFNEHAVLLVGFDEEYVYVNNPINGKKAEKTAKQPFIESWIQLDKQAVTYVP